MTAPVRFAPRPWTVAPRAAADPAAVRPRRAADPAHVRAAAVDAEDGPDGRAATDVRPALATVPDVELLEVGTWHASTGVFTVTGEDLAAAVAAQDDPAIRPPVVKLGHTDPRFNAGMLAERIFDTAVRLGIDDDVARLLVAELRLADDGQPALGRVDRLRLTADRTALVGDMVGVPRWLADVMWSAYPSRSVEAEFDVDVAGHVETATGRVHRLVVTGVALLGDALPAVETLGDVRRLYYPDDTD